MSAVILFLGTLGYSIKAHAAEYPGYLQLNITTGVFHCSCPSAGGGCSCVF
jgi:hypothetical protein